MFACQLIHNHLECQFWMCTYLQALREEMGEKALYISPPPPQKNPQELHLDIKCFKQNQLLFTHVQNHLCGSHWNTVSYYLWGGQSVALINLICADKVSQNTTLLFTVILPTKFTHYIFQPIEGAVPRWDNTKMYTKEGNVKMKEASSYKSEKHLPSELYIFVLSLMIARSMGWNT